MTLLALLDHLVELALAPPLHGMPRHDELTGVHTDIVARLVDLRRNIVGHLTTARACGVGDRAAFRVVAIATFAHTSIEAAVRLLETGCITVTPGHIAFI